MKKEVKKLVGFIVLVTIIFSNNFFVYAQNDNEQKNISETKEEYQIQVLNELKELGINARISNGEIELVNKSYENIQKVNVLIDENDEKVNYTYSNELSYASGGKYPTS